MIIPSTANYLRRFKVEKNYDNAPKPSSSPARLFGVQVVCEGNSHLKSDNVSFRDIHVSGAVSALTASALRIL